jgi:hypothetical protein
VDQQLQVKDMLEEQQVHPLQLMVAVAAVVLELLVEMVQDQMVVQAVLDFPVL